MRRLPSLLVNLVITVLAIAAIGWSVVVIRGAGSPEDTTRQRTVMAGRGTITATVTADGTLEPATTATAGFDTSGTVTAVYVKVGQKVTAGQLLAKVDPADAQRDLDLAQANLAAANDALNRAVAAGVDTGAAQSAVDAARLAVDDATAAVAGTKLAAPMAGTVTAVNGTIGSSGAGGEDGRDAGFVEIANLGELQVRARFSEADATRVEAGQDATITWSALPGATATGKVLAVDPAATTSGNVVTYGVTTSVGTLPEGARAGQSVEVTVTTGTASDAIYVNAAAVTRTGDRYTVTVLGADGTRQTRQVRVGLRGDDAYEITEGLAPGEKVVLPESGR